MITLNYQLTVKDRLEAAQTHTLSPFKSRTRLHNLYNIFWLLIVGGYVWLSLRNFWIAIYQPSQITSTSSFEEYITNGCFQIIISFWMLNTYLPKWSPLKVWKLQSEWKRQAIVYKPRSFAITETGAKFETEGYQEFKQWQHYNKFAESKELFLLYYSESLFHILPKRLFTDVAEIDRLRDLLQNNLKL
jgi:hypothetical protein